MKSDPIADLPSTGLKPLTQVLGQSARIKETVEECAEELSVVNVDLKRELTEHEPRPGIEKALEKSEQVETKVQGASEQLSVVNRALEGEVRDRHVLENQLAEVTEKEEAAQHAAFHDPLTGLPNRALFNDRLEHGLAQARRHHRILAVMFMDLNDFKIINDSHGHDIGDGVLRKVAARLKEHTRSDDTVSRHGGDEFLYLLTEIQDQQDVVAIAEKVINLIEAPFDVSAPEGDIAVTIKVSIGISIFPGDGSTADALIKKADQAMYVAKRNRFGYSLAQAANRPS